MFKPLLVLALCLLCFTVSSASILTAELTDICKLVPPNTKILQPGSCIDWAECNYEGEVIDDGSCLEGWYFDRNTSRCNKSTHVDCPYASHLKSPCANLASGTFLPHPEMCNGFIYCKDGVEQYSACPEGLNFEPTSQSCVYPKLYTCPEREGDGVLSEICMSVGDNIRMADPTSCTAFRQCTRGILKTTQCIPGSYFSRKTGLCGELEDSDCNLEETVAGGPISDICGTDQAPIVGFIPDEKTCSGYYYCDEMENGKADRKPIFGKCTDGKFFDANLFSCKDRTNVRCTFDRCEGMGNKFANKQGDCSKYTYCHDGVSTSEGACPENFFFDEKAQSCTKKFISYMACVD